MRLGITGASGYIGRALLRATPPGWQVGSLGRGKVAPAFEQRHADLSQPVPAGLLDGLDAVVHLAADTGDGGVAARQEIGFARDLARTAGERGIPMVFLSSQAASPHAPTGYGRTKAAIESAILPLHAAVLRPGLVYGGEERGLFGMLCALLRRSPLRPRLWPSPPVQPIHVDDLCAAIITVLGEPAFAGTVVSVAGPPVAFDVFLAALARYRLRTYRLPMPVPVAVLRPLLVLTERLFGPRLGPGRLDSLTQLPAIDTHADLQRLRIRPRDLQDGMSRSGSPRRRLLLEGRALARSLLGNRAVSAATLRRYVRALAMYDSSRALGLARLLLACPVLLAALDRPARRSAVARGELPWRMELMYRLCESDP